MTAVIFRSSSPDCYFWETPTVFLSGGSDNDNKCGDGNRWALQPSAQTRARVRERGPIKRLAGHRGHPGFLRSYVSRLSALSLIRRWNFGSSVLRALGSLVPQPPSLDVDIPPFRGIRKWMGWVFWRGRFLCDFTTCLH